MKFVHVRKRKNAAAEQEKKRTVAAAKTPDGSTFTLILGVEYVPCGPNANGDIFSLDSMGTNEMPFAGGRCSGNLTTKKIDFNVDNLVAALKAGTIESVSMGCSVKKARMRPVCPECGFENCLCIAA